jgi:hypothetical protein
VLRLSRSFCAILIGVGVLATPALRSWQEPLTAQPKKTAPAAQIFSGTVTKLTDNAITVVRKVVGHDPVTREFMRDPQTQVEGKLSGGARVTVRYKAADDGGFLAVHIIVR